MALDIPLNEPAELRAGITWEWRREDLSTNFPADGGWTLTYYFKKTGATPGNFSLVAAASGKFFAITETAANSANRAAGQYTWAAVATKAAETREIDRGKLTILPRYDAAANLDDRSHAVKVLEAIEAVIENRASSTQREMVSYTIGTRSQNFDLTESKATLLELHSKYKWLVKNEDDRAKIAAGQPNPRNIGIRFNSSGGNG
jgi:hypothetical protein